MGLGKTIQVFLPDGNPRSIKIAEITSRTVQAVLIPRSKLDEAALRSELSNVGVYYLFGPLGDEVKPLVYVGEAEDCLVRLKQHNKNKDFWTHALVIVSRTQYFTKTHVKYLESFSYNEVLRVGRFRLENSANPPQPYIPESMEADLMDNFETIRILVSTLGYPLFDLIKKPVKKEILVCKGKDALAEGEYTEDGLIVLAGSTCNLEVVPSASGRVARIRNKLFDSGVLIEDGKVLKFTQNYIFNSPSAASDVILGKSSNGWICWKYTDGKTLDEVKRNNG